MLPAAVTGSYGVSMLSAHRQRSSWRTGRDQRSTHLACALCLATTLMWSACDPSVSDGVGSVLDAGPAVDPGADPDAGPGPGPDEETDAGPAPLEITELDGDAEVDIDIVAAEVDDALPFGDALVVARGSTFTVVDASGAERVSGSGAPRAAVALDDEALGGPVSLIATDEALWVFSLTGEGPAVVARSPLGDATGPIAALLAIDDVLWLAADSGLYRYTVDTFEEVRLLGEPVVSATLAGPLPLNGTLCLVVAREGRLFAIENEAVSAAFDLGLDGVTAFGVDNRGALWATTAGAVLERSFDGLWIERYFDADVVMVAAARRSSDVWMIVGDRAVHARAGVFLDAGEAPTSVRAAVDGSAVVVTTSRQAARWREGRSVRVEQPAEAEILQAAVRLQVRSLPRFVESEVRTQLDGQPIENDAMLDPAVLAPGLHRLVVTSTWGDGVVRETERQFFARAASFPTWQSNIRQIFERSCSSCHTITGGAHVLDQSASWRLEIDRIVEVLDSGEMPLGRTLPDEDRRAVRLWAATGMQE